MRFVRNGILAAVLGLALAILPLPRIVAAQESVTLSHGDLTLNGNLVLAEGKSLADGIVLITHGTLAHNGMEIIAAMQTALAERDLSSLAITLGLGLDNRTGMYDCAVPHTHRHTDALDEIGAWIGWLKTQGTGKLVLMGHSRGGNQTAWFMATRPDPAIERVVLLAPGTWNDENARAGYQKSHGVALDKVLSEAEAKVAAGNGADMLDNVGILSCPNAKVTAASFVSYYAPDPHRHTPDLLRDIAVPVLVIAGTKDTVVADLPEAMEPIADGDKVRFVAIEEADHFFRDFYAEDAADAIAEFIAE